MFPFWLELTTDVLEPLAVVAVTILIWLFQMLCPRSALSRTRFRQPSRNS